MKGFIQRDESERVRTKQKTTKLKIKQIDWKYLPRIFKSKKEKKYKNRQIKKNIFKFFIKQLNRFRFLRGRGSNDRLEGGKKRTNAQMSGTLPVSGAI